MNRKDCIQKGVEMLLYGLLIIFFSYTLANKSLLFNDFLINIAKSGLFEGNTVYAVAYFALLAEATSVVLLIYKKRKGLFVSLGMVISFTIYILILHFNNKYEVCGCGGILNGLLFEYHLSINLLLIIIIIYLIKQDER